MMTWLLSLVAALAVLLWPRRSPDRPQRAGSSTPSALVREPFWRRDVGDLLREAGAAVVAAAARRRTVGGATASGRPFGVPSRVMARITRRPGPTAGECADLAEALVPCLEAGLTPAQACAVVAEGVAPRLAPTVTRLAASGMQGEAASEIMGEVVGLRTVATAWSLSERLGSPLADSVGQAAASLRRAEAVRRAGASAAAGPRASMIVLSLLPLSGPLVGWLLGVSPVELYARSALTVLCPVVGGALTAVGWWWGNRLVRGALRAPGERS